MQITTNTNKFPLNWVTTELITVQCPTEWLSAPISSSRFGFRFSRVSNERVNGKRCGLPVFLNPPKTALLWRGWMNASSTKEAARTIKLGGCFAYISFYRSPVDFRVAVNIFSSLNRYFLFFLLRWNSKIITAYFISFSITSLTIMFDLAFSWCNI